MSESSEPDVFSMEERNGNAQEGGDELLEDEEMPTYVSVSTSHREDDADHQGSEEDYDPLYSGPREPVSDGPSPCPSVLCVLDSSDEESDRHSPYDDDEEDDNDDDEDDIEEIDEMEDEEEEEEEEGFDDEVDGEDSDECNLDGRRTAEDDLILGYSVVTDQLERSMSLQDLSEHSLKLQARPIRKRHSADILEQNDHGSRRNSLLFSLSSHRRLSAPVQYRHIGSKVKPYIREKQELSKGFSERRQKLREVSIVQENNKQYVLGNKQEDIKSAQKNKHIKDYAKPVIEDLENEEARLQNDMGMGQEVENGEEIKAIEDSNENISNDLYLKQSANEKLNGIVEDDMVVENEESREKFTETNEECLVNGQEQVHNILNIHTMNYEDYMKSDQQSDYKLPVISETHTVFMENDREMVCNEVVIATTEISMNNELCELKIENVQSIGNTALDDITVNHVESEMVMETSNQDVETTNEAESDVALLRTQLALKTSENVELRQELENLKKVLVTYQKEKQLRQLKAVAIQTDALPGPAENKEDNGRPSHSINKLSTSSLGSAVSSNDPWSDSVYSPPISRAPPNLTPLFNSDDSYSCADGTPRRKLRPSSNAFLTSSRILKTLSSFTQGRSKIDNPKEVDNPAARCQLKESATTGISNLNSGQSLNTGNPKKRRASEMIGNSNFLQPPKMAHTSRGSLRSQSRLDSESDIDRVFKYPGDYVKLSARANTSHLSEARGSSEKPGETHEGDDEGKEGEADDLIDNVKCFTFHDDENKQERSFLILAEEDKKGLDEAGERGSIVRECGPYLLGNVEVRMSEVNGTINIWGKEVRQESTAEESQPEECTVPDEVDDLSSCQCYLKTPRFMNSGHMVCSTNKRPNVPTMRLHEADYAISSGSTLGSNPKISTSTLADLNVRQQLGCLFEAENADVSQSRDIHNDSHTCTNHKHIPNLLENHSCACHPKEIPKCCCREEVNNCKESPCSRVAQSCQGDHSWSGNTLNTRERTRCPHAKNGNFGVANEGGCGRQLRHRILESVSPATPCQHDSRKDNSFRNSVPLNNPSTSRKSTSTRDNDGYYSGSSCNQHSPSNDNDNNPLLQGRYSESPEVKRRRLSGRRVRGILMDFLRGCGDCKSTIGNTNKVNPVKFGRNPPYLRITPCTPSPSFSEAAQQKQSRLRNTNCGSANRCPHSECCESCGRRADMAAEIETQLEVFRAEMERLQSRSDSLLNMLNTLHATDLN